MNGFKNMKNNTIQVKNIEKWNYVEFLLWKISSSLCISIFFYKL